MKRAFVSVLLLLALALLAAASVSWSPAVTLQITDTTGEPAAGEPLRGPRLERFRGGRLKRLEQLERVLPTRVEAGRAAAVALEILPHRCVAARLTPTTVMGLEFP